MILYLYLFGLVFVTITNFVLAFFILQRNPRSLQNRMYAYTILMIVLWGLGQILIKLAISEDWAIIGMKIAALGYIFIPSFFLYFVLAFTKAEYVWNSWLMYALIFFPAIIFLYAHWNTSVFVSGMQWTAYGPVAITGIGIYFFVAYFVCAVTVALWLTYAFYHKTRFQREKTQAVLILWGTGIPLFVGLFFDVQLWFFGFHAFYVSILLTTVNTVLISYAIIKYRFLALPELLNADLILSAIRDVVIVVDSNAQIIRINKSGVELLGYAPAKIPGMKLSDLLKGVKSMETMLSARSSLKDTPSYLYTYDKKKIPVHLTRQVIVDAAGEAMGAVIVARDVRDPELLEAKRNLRDTLERKVEQLKSFAEGVA